MTNPDEDIDDTVEDTNDDDTGNDDAGSDDTGDEDSEDTSSEDGASGDDDSDGAPSKSGEDDSTSQTSSRKESRVQKLARERNELREQLAAAKAIAEERSRSSQPVHNSAEAARLRNERLALMDESERKEYLQKEQLDHMQQQILLTQIQTADTIDRSQYQLMARSNPVYAKHASEVERRLAAERNAGRNWTREQVLAQVIGEAALKAKPDKKGKSEAQTRVNSTKSKPVTGRSDSSSYRPSKGGKESFEDLERRLENVVF